MAKRQKDTVEGQVMPWSVVLGILEIRDQTKVPSRLHARSRQLIQEAAEVEFSAVVSTYLYGGI